MVRDVECFTCGEEPSPLRLLGCPVIDRWTIEVRPTGKELNLVVRGQTRRHPEYADGEDICTAAVLWFDRKARFVRTALRLYALGEQADEEIPLDRIVTE